MSARAKLGLAALLLIATGGAAMLGLIGIRKVAPGGEPLQEDELAGYNAWSALLARHVAPSGVAYDSLIEDPQLRSIAATFAEFGPRSRPELFPTRDHELAYHLNAYNVLTLLGVVDRWPIDSVQDVKGPIRLRAGFGFFYGLRFRLDGRGVNLYDLENKTIRPYGDARIHAAINCASASCPTLQGHAFVADSLDAQLDAATRGFVADDRHVRWDEAGRTVHLSSIFTWFDGDFAEHSAALGGEADTLAWIARYTEDPARQALAARARAEGWARTFVDYDWSLNRRP